MRLKLYAVISLATALGISGCKLVKTADADGQFAGGGGGAGIASLVDETYDAKLVPLLRDNAVDITVLKSALAKSPDEAGKSYGVRAGGAGGSWNFPIKGTARVIEEDRQSKAGIAGVDIDGDGKVDATLQLGPVVKGTALRDVAPGIYDFSAFRDQIEFAKLGRSLNDKAVSAIAAKGDLTGKTISFVGAAAIRSSSEKPQIVPVVLEVEP